VQNFVNVKNFRATSYELKKLSHDAENNTVVATADSNKQRRVNDSEKDRQ